MYATRASFDRVALPRSLVGRRRAIVVYKSEFCFAIGAEVGFGNNLRAIVLDRRRTVRGLELYDIQLTGETYGRQFRTVRVDSLEPIPHPA